MQADQLSQLPCVEALRYRSVFPWLASIFSRFKSRFWINHIVQFGTLELKVNTKSEMSKIIIFELNIYLTIHWLITYICFTFFQNTFYSRIYNESKINAVKLRNLRSMIGLILMIKWENTIIRERCGITNGVVTKIEKEYLDGLNILRPCIIQNWWIKCEWASR